MCSSLKKIIKTKALPMESFIFPAEACAIELALYIVSKEKHKKFIIFSDSVSVLLSLNNKKLQHPLIIKLLCRLHSTSNKEIVFFPRGVMVKAEDCGIVVREFVLQSRYCVHFLANTLGKGMNPLILPAMG